MSNVNFILGDNFGKCIMEIAQEKLLYKYDGDTRRRNISSNERMCRMILLLGFIMVVSISCSLFYGAALFAYFDLYEKHKYFYEKVYYLRKSHKKFIRYNLLRYRHSVKKFIVSLLITIISLIIGYSIL